MQYDGSIKINTQIDSKNASSQFMALENRIVKTADKIAALRSKMDALKNAQVPTQAYHNLENELSAAVKEMQRMIAQNSKFSDVGNRIQKLSQSSAEYAEKMKEVAAQKIPTQEYTTIQRQIELTKQKINDLVARQEKFLATGGRESSSAYKRMQYDLDQLQNSLPYMEGELQDLIDTGKAFTLGSDTEQYKNLSAKYNKVNAELEKQKAIHTEIAQKQAESIQKVAEIKAQMQQLVAEGKAFRSGTETEEYANLSQQLKYAQNDLAVLNQRHKELEQRQTQNRDGYKRLGKSAIDGAKVASKAVKGMKDILKSSFDNILKYGLGIRTGIKEGFSNFANYSDSFKATVDSLKGSFLTLKNSFAAAFVPIVEIAIPYIQKLIDYLSRFFDMVGRYVALAMGQKIYTKAIKQTTGAIEDQNKAQNKQLSGLDKLNNLSSGNGAGDNNSAEVMFEEGAVDGKLPAIFQQIADYAEQLKNIFSQGFWNGLGDWEYRWESIKESIGTIKDSLVDIWTDPAVLSAADGYNKSIAYMLGSVAGSVASIGLTVATNLAGGISKYLEQNKDKIKDFVVNMFNIGEDINYLTAEFSEAIAYVFEAFASEDAQQLTANIIGIFTDAIMGVLETAGKLARDVLNIFIQPFVDNKEEFRTALEGFLGVLSEVTGTIKEGIGETFAKLNEVYDEHFKPFFDSIANGLSDTVGKFMEFWNGSVQPILDEWAVKFDEVWKAHIQPALNKFTVLLGKVADLLKTVWENVLKPFVDWVIENILPVLLPIFDGIGKAVLSVFGTIGDVISGILDALGGVIDFLTGVFSGDWEKAWNGIVDMFKGIFNLIPTIIEGIINTAIDIINGIIGGINAVATKVPGVPSIPEIEHISIPRLATGTVVPPNREFLAVLGDNKREPEVVSPLSTMKQAVKEALSEAGEMGSNGEINLNLTVECEGYQLISLFQKLDKEYFKQYGKHVLA